MTMLNHWNGTQTLLSPAFYPHKYSCSVIFTLKGHAVVDAYPQIPHLHLKTSGEKRRRMMTDAAAGSWSVVKSLEKRTLKLPDLYQMTHNSYWRNYWHSQTILNRLQRRRVRRSRPFHIAWLWSPSPCHWKGTERPFEPARVLPPCRGPDFSQLVWPAASD